MKIIFEKIDGNSKLPTKATQHSACDDVYAHSIKEIKQGVYKVGIGLRMQPEDPNYKIVLVPRSSLSDKRWVVTNSPGQGDADYRGEYSFVFTAIPKRVWEDEEGGWVIGYPGFPYKVGDRIGQIFLQKVIPIEYEEGSLPHKTDRKGGFGSTGK